MEAGRPEPEVDQPASAEGKPDLPVALGVTCVGFYVASIGVVLVVLSADLGVPVEQLSWIGSAFGYGLIVMAFAGPWLLRLGPRTVLMVAAGLLGLGSILISVIPGAAAAYAGAILQGLGAAAVVLVAPNLLRGPDAAERLTRANAVASIAAVCAPLVMGLAAATAIGARPALLLVVAAILALIFAARRIQVPDSPRTTDGVGSTASKPLVLRRWLTLVCAVSVEFTFVVWGVARLIGTGIDASMAAVVGASFQVGMALGRLIGPRLIAALPMVLVGSGFAAAGALLVALSTVWPLVGLGQLIAGMGVATLYPITLANLMATPGLRPELGASLGALGSGVAITVAPTALAALATAVDLQVAFFAPLPVLLALVWLHHEGRSSSRSSQQ